MFIPVDEKKGEFAVKSAGNWMKIDSVPEQFSVLLRLILSSSPMLRWGNHRVRCHWLWRGGKSRLRWLMLPRDRDLWLQHFHPQSDDVVLHCKALTRRRLALMLMRQLKQCCWNRKSCNFKLRSPSDCPCNKFLVYFRLQLKRFAISGSTGLKSNLDIIGEIHRRSTPSSFIIAISFKVNEKTEKHSETH